MMKLHLTAAAAAAFLVASSANAATYFGTLTAGSTTATYSIDTDGATGRLFQGNLTGFAVTVTGPNGTATVTNGNNFTLNGAMLSATATELLFDTTQSGYLIFGESGSVFQGVCLTGNLGSCAGEPSQSVFLSVNYPSSGGFESRVAGATQYVLAQTQTAAVPEPATWAMMLIGFGGIGASMRRRKQVATVKFA